MTAMLEMDNRKRNCSKIPGLRQVSVRWLTKYNHNKTLTWKVSTACPDALAGGLNMVLCDLMKDNVGVYQVVLYVVSGRIKWFLPVAASDYGSKRHDGPATYSSKWSNSGIIVLVSESEELPRLMPELFPENRGTKLKDEIR